MKTPLFLKKWKPVEKTCALCIEELELAFSVGRGEGQQGLVLSALLGSHSVVHRGQP